MLTTEMSLGTAPDSLFELVTYITGGERRAKAKALADGVAATFGYAVRFEPIGPVDPVLGPPTQLALFDLLTPPEVPEP